MGCLLRPTKNTCSLWLHKISFLHYGKKKDFPPTYKPWTITLFLQGTGDIFGGKPSRCPMNEITRMLIFLPLGKQELCEAKGCIGDFADPKGHPCNCVAFKLHVPKLSACVCVLYKHWRQKVDHISKFRQNITRPEGFSKSFLRKYVRWMPSSMGPGVIIPKTCNLAFYNEFNTRDHLFPLQNY